MKLIDRPGDLGLAAYAQTETQCIAGKPLHSEKAQENIDESRTDIRKRQRLGSRPLQSRRTDWRSFGPPHSSRAAGRPCQTPRWWARAFA